MPLRLTMTTGHCFLHCGLWDQFALKVGSSLNFQVLLGGAFAKGEWQVVAGGPRFNSLRKEQAY